MNVLLGQDPFPKAYEIYPQCHLTMKTCLIILYRYFSLSWCLEKTSNFLNVKIFNFSTNHETWFGLTRNEAHDS